MKIANKYFKPLSLLLVLALMVVSCNEFQEFESTTYGPGPTVTLAQVSVQDSTFTISVTSSEDGHASVILLPGSGNTAPEDPEDLLTGNINAMDYQSKSVKAGEAANFTFSGLVQYAVYEVMGAANNGDGKPSEVATIGVGTDDTHAPALSGTDPAVGYDPVLAVDGSVVLVFDEPVLYDDTKDLTFSEFYDGVDLVAGEVVVDFNTVTITPAEELTNRDYLWLSYPEGAFTDHSGNLAAEVATGLNDEGTGFEGLFWRAEAMEFDTIGMTPAEGNILPAAFDIVLTFAQGVDVDDVVDGDMTLTYDDGLNTLTRSVLASELTAAGNTLTISHAYTPAAGMNVTLDIPAETFLVGYGNPNAEISATWSVLHPLQNWLGDYTVAAASYAAPGDYDEVWSVSIASYADDLTKLAITIDAGSGGGVPFLATFDDVAGTITIPSGSDAGAIYGYGPSIMYVGDYATIDMVSDITGTIDPDGTILIDNLAMYLSNYAYYWDAFNTTWTPAAKKAAVSPGFNASKAAGIK